MPPHTEVKGSDPPKLTPNDIHVLHLICRSYTTEQIADRLGVSLRTAAYRRMRLLEKAGVHNSVNLLRWALETGHIKLAGAQVPASPTAP
jgi:DNA-binding CsgD family transcriptional regulator